jgi:hypothetical protein
MNPAIYILPVLGVIFVSCVSALLIRYPGRNLNKKVLSLGVVVGKTYKEIVEVLGTENSRSVLGNGNILRQWMRTGYHICFIFDKDDICLGISNETMV